jgi:diguanylate cyclase (GGDEF)-like protein
LAVAFVDLDHFKEVNDRYGHEAGDRQLADFSRHLLAHLRATDLPIRWGGEEFLLIFPFTNCEKAAIAMSRLMADGLGTRPDGTPQTASIGIAERTADEITDFMHLVEIADQRMYQAKKRGRSQVVSPA